MSFFIKKKRQIKPLPFPVYFWTVFVVAVAGLLDSIYLSISHYRVFMDIGYRSFCSISKSVNCDTVSQSPYSILMGIPVPIWGIIGYVFFLIILFFAFTREAQGKRVWSFLFVISLAYSVYSMILAYISVFYIHSYCFMCVMSYGINFMLVFFTWLVKKRFEGETILYGLKEDTKYLWAKKSIASPIVVIILVSTFLLAFFFPKYWDLKPPEISRKVTTGITEDNYPWIGAEKPEIEIIEFTDYMCFQCRKMHFYIRQLIAKYPDKIKLIHRHFPMDHRFNPFVKKPFHIGTGEMALLAIYAASKNKFWVMNDILFSIDKRTKEINLKKIAKATGLNLNEMVRALNDSKLRNELHVDIMYGLKNGIVGTPSYIIDNKVYRGQIPPEILNRLRK